MNQNAIDKCLNCPYPTCNGRCPHKRKPGGGRKPNLYGGRTLDEWAQITGIKRMTMYKRLRAGMDAESAARAPLASGKKWCGMMPGRKE